MFSVIAFYMYIPCKCYDNYLQLGQCVPVLIPFPLVILLFAIAYIFALYVRIKIILCMYMYMYVPHRNVTDSDIVNQEKRLTQTMDMITSKKKR